MPTVVSDDSSISVADILRAILKHYLGDMFPSFIFKGGWLWIQFPAHLEGENLTSKIVTSADVPQPHQKEHSMPLA